MKLKRGLIPKIKLSASLCVVVSLLVLLAVAASAQAQTYSVLYSFGPGGYGPDGNYPQNAGLVRDSAGNLYGTTSGGGAYGGGTVFELSPPSTSGGAWTETVLFSFGATYTDASGPQAGLVMDSGGTLYGVTTYGGDAGGYGTVFALKPSTSPPGPTSVWTESVLYSFTGGADGRYPKASLILDASNRLYGTTEQGGASGYGTVFQVGSCTNLPPGVICGGTSGYWEVALYSFGADVNDGQYPEGALVMDSSGNLYGTTSAGGTNGGGIVFELNSLNFYAENVLYNFGGGNDGWQPMAGLIRDSSGNFYGTTESGGDDMQGTVFELSPPTGGGASWTETLLYSFGVHSGDGGQPEQPLVMDASGNLYGATPWGGDLSCKSGEGCGIVFEFIKGYGGYSPEFIAHTFGMTSGDGMQPEGSLVLDASGNLYGTTYEGGANGAGTVFEITAAPAPAVTLSTTSLDFGSQVVGVTSTVKTVTVTNSGAAPLDFGPGAVTISGANAADFGITADGCTVEEIPSGSACPVGVTFTPSVAGSETASLNFADNAPDSPQSVALTGTGAAPSVSVSPASLTFSGQLVGSTSTAQTVTLTNSSGIAVAIQSVGTTGDFAETNTCGSSVGEANPNCTISVTFKPTASGARSGTLSITDSAAGSPQTVALTGTGQDFSMSASVTSKNVARGGTATFDLQVAPLSGFAGTVTLACSGAPAKSTCTVSPASVTLDGTNNASATVSVSTTANSISMPLPLNSPPGPPIALWVILAGLAGLAALARFGAKRVPIRFGVLAPLAVLILSLAFAASCGGGGNTPVNTGTPAGTYPLTITGTSGGVSHTAALSLGVQ